MFKKFLVGGLVVLAGVAGVVPKAESDNSRRVRYVAKQDDGWVVNPTVEEVDVRGDWNIVPTATSFTVSFDDKGHLDGTTIPVAIRGSAKSYFLGCMPVRQTVTISGVSAGQSIAVEVGSLPIAWETNHPGRCSSPATAGVATFTRVQPVSTHIPWP